MPARCLLCSKTAVYLAGTLPHLCADAQVGFCVDHRPQKSSPLMTVGGVPAFYCWAGNHVLDPQPEGASACRACCYTVGAGEDDQKAEERRFETASVLPLISVTSDCPETFSCKEIIVPHLKYRSNRGLIVSIGNNSFRWKRQVPASAVSECTSSGGTRIVLPVAVEAPEFDLYLEDLGPADPDDKPAECTSWIPLVVAKSRRCIWIRWDDQTSPLPSDPKVMIEFVNRPLDRHQSVQEIMHTIYCVAYRVGYEVPDPDSLLPEDMGMDALIRVFSKQQIESVYTVVTVCPENWRKEPLWVIWVSLQLLCHGCGIDVCSVVNFVIASDRTLLLELAGAAGQEVLVRDLLEHGADPCQVGSQGLMCMDHCGDLPKGPCAELMRKFCTRVGTPAACRYLAYTNLDIGRGKESNVLMRAILDLTYP